MSKRPLITLGISCFNAEKTIARAIESALNQSWKNKEIIVVDDVSEDSSVTIIKEFIKQHEIIKLHVNEDNLGVATVRNKIIEHSKGEFIAFFDDDDSSEYDRVERQYNRIVEYSKKWHCDKPIICHTARRVVYGDGISLTERTIGCNVDNMAPHGVNVASRILLGSRLVDGDGSMATCSQMGSAKVYAEVGGFDENLRRSEDTELNIRLALSGCHFIGIGSPLVTQYITKSEDKNFEVEYESTLYYINKYKNFIMRNSSYSFVKSWVNLKFIFYKKDYFIFLIKFIVLFFQYPVLSTRRIFLSIPNFQINRRFGNNRQ